MTRELDTRVRYLRLTGIAGIALFAAELAKPRLTQVQQDAARQAGTWGGVEDAGRKARAADRARQGPDHERPGERQGPRM